jgi:hypothetical protein
MVKTTENKEASPDVTPVNVWKHIERVLETEGS